MAVRKINLMPKLREQARGHSDLRVKDDGSVTLKEGVEQASVSLYLSGPEGYPDE